MIKKIEIGIRLLFGGFSFIFIGLILKNLGLIMTGLIIAVFSIIIIKHEKGEDFLDE